MSSLLLNIRSVLQWSSNISKFMDTSDHAGDKLTEQDYYSVYTAIETKRKHYKSYENM